MARVDFRTGCKVAWDTYDNEAEANAAAATARVDAQRQWERGYDFGYQVPGGIQHIPDHLEHGEVWIVTIP
jgi:hypothetical protein